MSEPIPLLSVVICTHNPRADFISRTLAGLRAQTLPLADWELVVIDNASSLPVGKTVESSWHPGARIVAESELGLTAARLRGIAEARAGLLVFVDDDNILAPGYLAQTLALAGAWPMLGVWGCGCYTPEWEIAPPAAFAPYLAYLAVQTAPRDRWTNQAFDYAATPAGAGLCARASVARAYADLVRHDPRRKALGRTGTDLAGCEDFDLALTAIDLGLGTGVFTSLALTHLMPRSRVEESYLLRLVEGHARSTVLLHALRDAQSAPHAGGLLARVREFRLRSALDPIALKIHDAKRKGERSAWTQLGFRS
jgi:GT2 family glycosyltransferase